MRYSKCSPTRNLCDIAVFPIFVLLSFALSQPCVAALTENTICYASAKEEWGQTFPKYKFEGLTVSDLDGDGIGDVLSSYSNLSIIGGGLVAVSGRNGEILWDLAVPSEPSLPPVLFESDESKISFLISGDAEISAIETELAPSVLWTVTLEMSEPTVLISAPKDYRRTPYVVIGGYDGRLYMLNATTGQEVWNVSRSSPVVFLATLDDAYSSFPLIAADSEGSVFVLDLSEGDVGWERQLPGESIFFTEVGDSHFVTVTFDGDMLLVNGTSGDLEMLGHLDIDGFGPPEAPPVVFMSGPREVSDVVFATQTAIHCFDVSEQTLQWRYDSRQTGQMWNNVKQVDIDADDDPDVLGMTFYAALVGFDGETGRVLLNFTDVQTDSGPTFIHLWDLDSSGMSEAIIVTPERANLVSFEDADMCLRPSDGDHLLMALLAGSAVVVVAVISYIVRVVARAKRKEENGQT